MVLVAGIALAKQWDQYTDFTAAPNGADTLLFYDTSEGTDSEKIKEITVSYFMGAIELKPVYVDMAGTTTYTIDLSLGNVFFIDQVGHKGIGGVTVYMPDINAGTSQYANRPYTVVNNTISGTSIMWLVPQYDLSQCTQWVVSESGVSNSQSGTSAYWHARMNGRMDNVTFLPRYVSSTGGTTHYVIKDEIR